MTDPSPTLKDFDHPSLTVDVALVTVVEGVLSVLLQQRRQAPEAGRWALPGGFVHCGEPLEATVQRILRDKARLPDAFVEQLFTFGDPGRDPRGHVVTVAYYALIPAERINAALQQADDLSLARIAVPWRGEAGGAVTLRDPAGRDLSLAFDHAEILGTVVKRLRGKLDYTTVGLELLPARFTLRALQTVHETVLGRPLNKDSFRRRMLASGELEATGEREQAVRYRPAELYRFVRRQAV